MLGLEQLGPRVRALLPDVAFAPWEGAVALLGGAYPELGSPRLEVVEPH